MNFFAMPGRVCLAMALGVMIAAAPLVRAEKNARVSGESLAAWPWQGEAPMPGKPTGAYVDFLAPPLLLDRARPDLTDLRLRDARGLEVPYALRIRRPLTQQQVVPAQPFNPAPAPVGGGAAEVSLDLGAMPVSHTEIQIATTGQNFRRRLRLEASDDSKTWQALVEKAELLSFDAEGQHLHVDRVAYAESRRRYIRLSVQPDPAIREDRPAIGEVHVYQGVLVPGLNVTWPVNLGPREDTRWQGNPASAWLLSFEGLEVPCEALEIEAAETRFDRPYAVEIMPDDPVRGTPTTLIGGTWRRDNANMAPLVIKFNEVRVKRLRLVIVDYRNPPLTIRQAKYSAPARQVIFAASADLGETLSLYVGNPVAEAPHYDFAALLPPRVEATRLDLGELTLHANPEYRPPLKPFAERYPWAIYVVLGAVSLVLLGLLIALARQALAYVPTATEA